MKVQQQQQQQQSVVAGEGVMYCDAVRRALLQVQ